MPSRARNAKKSPNVGKVGKVVRKSQTVARKSQTVARKSRKVARKSRKVVRKMSTKEKKCRAALGQKIGINIAEFEKGTRYVSRAQAIAVAYSQVKANNPSCSRYFVKK